LSSIKHNLNLKADQCVKCGLCLPHCPTYRIYENENESPRGRIALIQGLINEQFPVSHRLKEHLDHCLSCLACERVCPSGVKYGELLDHAKQSLSKKHTTNRYLVTQGLRLAKNKSAQKRLQNLLFIYQRSGLQALLRLFKLSSVEKITRGVSAYKAFSTSNQTKSKKLGLFTGCTGHMFDQQTIKDCIFLLEKLGYEVVIPEQQTCCGALHQHNGEMDTARELASKNLAAFTGLNTVVYVASGCGAQLRQYHTQTETHPSTQSDNPAFIEICQFLSKEDLSQFKFRAFPQSVSVHTPCSMRNALRQKDPSPDILKMIPDIRLNEIPAETGCCGAAGSYMLSQPALAATVRQATLDVIENHASQAVTTSNIGCRLHLSAGLPNKIDTMHPVSLLVKQLIR